MVVLVVLLYIGPMFHSLPEVSVIVKIKKKYIYLTVITDIADITSVNFDTILYKPQK